jgi:TonB family protein
MLLGRITRSTFAYDLRCKGIARILMTNSSFIPRITHRPLATALLLAAIPALAARGAEPGAHLVVTPERTVEPGGPHVNRDFGGTLSTAENLTLKLNTDLGSVRILPLQPGATPVVRYSVHIETDARGQAAAQLLDRYALSAKNTPAGAEITGFLPQLSHGNGAQFWVHFEIAVPASYSLDVTTGAGDIQTSDVGGTASLVTEGGNIVGGKIGTNFAAGQTRQPGATARLVGKLETQGGHIQIEDVAGDLTAFTAGGHINTGYIWGEANLQSGGGHIRSAGIGGRAELATEGGNITVGRAAKLVTVKTGGGQIDFGEVHGSVRAQTGGGGIRVLYVAGPMDVESSGGSICLTRVSGSVRAATDSGTITAWINPVNSEKQQEKAVRLPGASQLTSGDGDIVVFLPRNLAANIEAIVENGGARRIEADPALALQVARVSQSSGAVKAWTSLNGGGAVLRLKTAGGRIKLQYSDSEMALWESMWRDQSARMERELTRSAMPAPVAFPRMSEAAAAPWPMPQVHAAPVAPSAEPQPPERPEPGDMLTGSWVDRMELRLIGGVRMDGDEFWQRIKRHTEPSYPEVARKSGIEGTVRLQVRMTRDGKIEVMKLLEGDTVLADAAMGAVKQWRGKPLWMDGKPVDVISTVTFKFKLRD